jgi:hypothetical protein
MGTQSLIYGFPASLVSVGSKAYFPSSRKSMKLIPEKFAHEVVSPVYLLRRLGFQSFLQFLGGRELMGRTMRSVLVFRLSRDGNLYGTRVTGGIAAFSPPRRYLSKKKRLAFREIGGPECQNTPRAQIWPSLCRSSTR